MHHKPRSLLGAAALLAAVLGGAVPPALAATITGTPSNDVLPGTPQRDTIRGLAGDDDITPGKGNDRAFGDEGDDTFHWAKGEGQDRLDGGPDTSFGDRLEIAAGMRLRLHIDALNAGRLTVSRSGLEAIGVKDIERISIRATDGDDRLIISSDAGILDTLLHIDTGTGRDRIDAAERRSRTNIQALGGTAGVLIRGSREFFDEIFTGPGDDEIWTGRGGSYVQTSVGSDEVHLGAGPDRIGLAADDSRGDKVIFGFGAGDFFDLFEIRSDFPRVLDTNSDGLLDVKDQTVKVRDGSMRIDLTATMSGQPTSLTLVGRTRVSMDLFVVDCGC